HGELVRLMRDPDLRVLTDSGLLDIQRGARTNFGDPWVFRRFTHRGYMNIGDMRRKIAAGEYDWILTTEPIEDPMYRSYVFGLPMPLVEVAWRRYVPAGRKAE